MDRRYGLQQGWENNSALEGYGAVHEPNYRIGSSYDDRRFIDERYTRDGTFPRTGFHRDIVERENHAGPPSLSLWPQTRRRGYEEEYSVEREPRRHEKTYLEPYHEVDSFREASRYETDVDNFRDGYRDGDNYHEHGFDRDGRFGMRERDGYALDDYDHRHRRDDSRERYYDYERYSYDSDQERRDGSWRRRDSHDRERQRKELSYERDYSPHRRNERSRSRSHGRDDHLRSRSPRGRSYSRSHREDSYDDDHYDRGERRRDREDKRYDHCSVSPSATVVVKGLSQKTTEEDLYQILAEWGPLRHVRVIKERNSGISRGFAFIDFPSVDAAQAMMDKVGADGLVADGRKLFFEYSSKPTGGAAGPSYGQDGVRSNHGGHRSMAASSDWMCTICGCINFARRVSCFQCNERRTDDAPAADVQSSNLTSVGRKGSDAVGYYMRFHSDTSYYMRFHSDHGYVLGPTHVLVVRGLDENADEDMLRYEFSKHAPVKDLRLIRDRLTHVSRGFAFLHFYSVEDATKALEATNGTTLEKNGQILRVAYSKSNGPGSGPSVNSQSSSLAAAAIEAAAFSQQYDTVGWAPKEYNPDDKQSTVSHEQGGGISAQSEGSAPQSGFVWDEASGYYYDAGSGFYYDPNTGLYYDGNNGIWYSFDEQTQQYVPCSDQNPNNTTEKQSEAGKTENNNTKKVVISAPAATIALTEKSATLPDAVQAAASAALAAEKKEKEKSKEIKLASKSSLLANKKKMNNVLSMWKQRSHEGQAPRVALDDGQSTPSADDRPNTAVPSLKSKTKYETLGLKENAAGSSGFVTSAAQPTVLEPEIKPRPISNSLGGTIMGVIRGSGLGMVKSDTIYSGSVGGASTPLASVASTTIPSSINSDSTGVVTPFRTEASALGSYAPPVATGSGKRRFSEAPMLSAANHKEQQQLTYRDRAAERRSLYGSTSSYGDGLSDLEFADPIRDSGLRKGASDVGSMPFPPGVGGRGTGDSSSLNYDVITSDRAIDESNVGNRMLRNMGWQEGLGLGKDGSGMVEPVQAQAVDSRAGLGSQQKRSDPNLELWDLEKFPIGVFEFLACSAQAKYSWSFEGWRNGVHRGGDEAKVSLPVSSTTIIVNLTTRITKIRQASHLHLHFILSSPLRPLTPLPPISAPPIPLPLALLSLLIGPFAPLSLTAGDIRVGRGKIVEFPVDDQPVVADGSTKKAPGRRQKGKIPDESGPNSNGKVESLGRNGVGLIRQDREFGDLGLDSERGLGGGLVDSDSVKAGFEGWGVVEEREWTEEDLELLRRQVLKHPVGKPRRWEVISEAFRGRHALNSVIKTAKSMGEAKPEDSNSYSKFLRNRKPADKRLVEASGDGESGVEGAGEVEGENGGGGEVRIWSSGEDIALLNALKAFPKDVAMRWDKIAAAVPGKSKAACMKRVAELKRDFRSSKVAANDS
ncbi:hypothetical protein Dimus_008488 [Dionaea muscipula]